MSQPPEPGDEAMPEAQGTAAAGTGPESPAVVLDARLALLLSARAWGMPHAATADLPAWRGLEPSWRQRLRPAEEIPDGISPETALGLLSRSSRLQRRAGLEAVHPSWWIRALQDESPAVRRLVADDLTPELRQALFASLPPGPGDLAPDRDPDPEVRAWVLALWAERVVGGEPLRADEPPAIVALAGPRPVARFRLFHAAGLAKIAMADLDPTGPAGPLRRDRLSWLGSRLGTTDPRARDWARRDLDRLVRDGGLRWLNVATLGLATLARLLADCDPFRVRWALQHLPYPVAKRARSLMPSPENRSAAACRLEAVILKAAWQRLTLEGRISPPHPEDRARESDVR
jgi:hypothetical protein